MYMKIRRQPTKTEPVELPLDGDGEGVTVLTVKLPVPETERPKTNYWRHIPLVKQRSKPEPVSEQPKNDPNR